MDRDSILDMLPDLAETAQADRAFSYWLQALLLASGYDSMVMDALYSAADWADGFLAQEGIRVTVQDGKKPGPPERSPCFIRTRTAGR